MDVSKYNYLCQKALHQGLQYAKSYGHSSLEVEHVALGLVRADATPLESARCALLAEDLRRHLTKLPKKFGKITVQFGLRLDRALDQAEADGGGSREVDETMLWDSLVRESSMLQNWLSLDEVHQASAVTNAESPTPAASDAATGATARSDKHRRALEEYTVDLSAQAERDELDPVIGRDGEVRRALEILGRKKKNNPILIGEPGVGKTSIAELLAQRIAAGQVPQSMLGKRVLALDLGLLLAGSKYRGEFEQRLTTLIEALATYRDEAILFIDEIHMLVGAGNNGGGMDAANLLKPALARGQLRCLGATTTDEYRQYIEQDPALERRFQPVTVSEPSAADTTSILRQLKSRYEVHHGVRILDEALEAAVTWSQKYIPERRLPDKAIDVLDEACSGLRLQIDSLPSKMDSLRSRIASAEIERQSLNASDPSAGVALTEIGAKLAADRQAYSELESIWNEHKRLLEKRRKYENRRDEQTRLLTQAKQQADYAFAARLEREAIPENTTKWQRVNTLLEGLQVEHPWLRELVGRAEIAAIISRMTRIPEDRILQQTSSASEGIDQRLSSRVFGQDTVLVTLARALRRSQLGIHDPNRPLGTFLFVGPTGVGKTEVAKALAAELFGDESKMIRLDMSEYMEAHSVAKMLGAPAGYVGYGDGGGLTEALRRSPYSVVLFDEIEKAHPQVLDMMLQIFDDGRITDASGKTVSCRHALFILTSNLPLDIPEMGDSVEAEDAKREQLGRHLRPELVGRLDEILLFKNLGNAEFSSLFLKLCDDLNTRLEGRQLHIRVDAALAERLVQRARKSPSGGRALRRLFQNQIVDLIASIVLKNPNVTGSYLIALSEDGKKIQWRKDPRHNIA